MVIPATNFTATFSKIGYLGIKRCLDKGKVNYLQDYIVQASYLKKILEELGVKREEVTIESVDAIDMFPLIKLAKIRKAGRYFKKNHQGDQEYHQPLLRTHSLRDELHPYLLLW